MQILPDFFGIYQHWLLDSPQMRNLCGRIGAVYAEDSAESFIFDSVCLCLCLFFNHVPQFPAGTGRNSFERTGEQYASNSYDLCVFSANPWLWPGSAAYCTGGLP